MDLWLRPWRRSFDFTGRATRREYWLFMGQILIAYLLIFWVTGTFGSPNGDDAFTGVMALLLIVFTLLIVVATTAALVRRLHDHDRSGWLVLLTLVPLVGWIFYLIMTLTPGTKGENDYGFDPRAGDRPSTDELASVFS